MLDENNHGSGKGLIYPDFLLVLSNLSCHWSWKLVSGDGKPVTGDGNSSQSSSGPGSVQDLLLEALSHVTKACGLYNSLGMSQPGIFLSRAYPRLV